MKRQDLIIKNRQQHTRTRPEQKERGVVVGRESNIVFSEFDKDIIVIRDYSNIKIQTLVAYDVIVLDYFQTEEASYMLSEIRSSVYDDVYLKPVLICTHGRALNRVDEEMADGETHSNSIEPLLDVVDEIMLKTEEILAVSSDFKGRKIMLKLIRFLYSRGTSLTPVPSSKSHMGYAFPFLDANISTVEYEELIHLLEIGTNNGLLQADFQDHVHLCPSCHSGFINYRETCSKCDTHKFKSQHTIHHFVCGYVGPESDFQSGSKLECPKCDKELRHIGVDYDKPSLVMECENGHIFQEPDMKTYCFNCHTEAKPEDLITYPINTYELTASGAEAAVSGKVKEEKELTELEGFVSLSVFKTFLKMEVERQKASGHKSTVSYMNLMISPTTYKKQANDYGEFIHEIARIVKSQLKATEMVSLINDELFLIMSPERSVKEVFSHLEQIKMHTMGALRGSVGTKNDDLIHESFEISGNQGTDSILDHINQRVNIF